MADSKLSDLSAAASLATTDLFYVVKTAGSGGVKATLSQLNTLYAGLGANTFTGIQSIPAGSKTSPTITFPQSITNGFYSAGDYDIRVAYNGKTAVRFNNTVLRVLDSNENQNIALDGQNAQIILGQSEDIKITRDAAGTLAQRNGANAQTLRVYSTWTDASNYERAAIKTTAGSKVEFAAETAGTGGDNLDVALTPAGTGGVTLGANYQQFTEMTAPAAGATNNVRIYAEDNGSGKTRLMALFPTGAAQQIAIEP